MRGDLSGQAGKAVRVELVDRTDEVGLRRIGLQRTQRIIHGVLDITKCKPLGDKRPHKSTASEGHGGDITRCCSLDDGPRGQEERGRGRQVGHAEGEIVLEPGAEASGERRVDPRTSGSLTSKREHKVFGENGGLHGGESVAGV